MKILAIYNTTIFISPIYIGGSIIVAELTEYDNNDLDNSLLYNSYAEAHKAAHLTIMSEFDYSYLYESNTNEFDDYIENTIDYSDKLPF